MGHKEEALKIIAEEPPKYEEATVLIQEAAPVASEEQVYTRYDTLTSFAGLDGYKIDPASIGQASYIVANNMIGGALDEPFPVQCPYCRSIVTTKTVHVAGCMAYLSCLVVGVLTSFLGCCIIPLCMRRCKDVKHYCPECNQLIAVYKRL